MSLTTSSTPTRTCASCNAVSERLAEIVSEQIYHFQSWTWPLDLGANAIAKAYGCSFCRYISNLIIEPWLHESCICYSLLRKGFPSGCKICYRCATSRQQVYRTCSASEDIAECLQQ
ncbi:hypothetical protein DOTSEDRAFT_72723 [Dothistroma septosporum NZE10]|uniref:Uncharacterized protein n=1 Tax=Dothistroma septosporum (strain NZE10 / CBS 128990) TaxID=675120 RepID=M2YP72_DOTSN|nr:hypothetical protein DOTSEDRAFT_72723 [Dothistroma septosporum NZE10]